jgi:uncharacterized protein with NRDE domain
MNETWAMLMPDLKQMAEAYRPTSGSRGRQGCASATAPSPTVNSTGWATGDNHPRGINAKDVHQGSSRQGRHQGAARQIRLVLLHAAVERLREGRHQRHHRDQARHLPRDRGQVRHQQADRDADRLPQFDPRCDGFAFVVSDRNLDWLDAFLESFDISVECASKKMEVPPEHGARMLNALAELSNKLLDTSGD